MGIVWDDLIIKDLTKIGSGLVIWMQMKTGLNAYIDKFPKNWHFLHAAGNLIFPESPGNFLRHAQLVTKMGFQVMGATAGQNPLET